MCGRAYETYTEEELQMRYLNEKAKRDPLGIRSNFNLSPTQSSPTILIKNGSRTISLLRWGLVPFWAKDIKSAAKYHLINAKGEEITEKRSYKICFEKRRCIVPLSGFIEWKREGEKNKRPFAIYLKDNSIMSVAGVWEHWQSQDTGETVDSFAIITTSANKFMAKIHNRMPVILDVRNEAEWLDPENNGLDSLERLLKPCPNQWLVAHEISTAINSPRNNRPEVLRPI